MVPHVTQPKGSGVTYNMNCFPDTNFLFLIFLIYIIIFKLCYVVNFCHELQTTAIYHYTETIVQLDLRCNHRKFNETASIVNSTTLA